MDRVDADPPAGPARALLDAVTAISSDLDLSSVLERLVVSAVELTGASSGALGFVGTDDGPLEVITTGPDPRAGTHVGDLGRRRAADLPGHGSPTGSLLGVEVRSRGSVHGDLVICDKRGGGPFDHEDETLVQALATAAGFVIENARAYALSERRRQWLEATAELTELLQPPIDLARAHEQIAAAARSVSRSSTAAVVDLSDGAVPTVVALDGPAEHLGPELLAAVGARLHRVADDVGAVDVVWGDQVAAVIPLRAHLARPSALVAVHAVGDHTGGVAQRELLASFADQAALALDRAQALVDREALALVSERERIARDLHDVVIQRLFATGLQLQGLRHDTVDDAMVSRIDTTVDGLDQTIRDIRGTIFALQQPRGALPSQVRALVAEYRPLLGFTLAVDLRGPLDTLITPELGTHLVAVLREAVSNVARHARATWAEVAVDIVAGPGGASSVRLRVTDDGVGLPSAVVESGVRNARHRATDLGGTLTLATRRPRGTALVWQVPLAWS